MNNYKNYVIRFSTYYMHEISRKKKLNKNEKNNFLFLHDNRSKNWRNHIIAIKK